NNNGEARGGGPREVRIVHPCTSFVGQAPRWRRRSVGPVLVYRPSAGRQRKILLPCRPSMYVELFRGIQIDREICRSAASAGGGRRRAAASVAGGFAGRAARTRAARSVAAVVRVRVTNWLTGIGIEQHLAHVLGFDDFHMEGRLRRRNVLLNRR